MGDVMQSTARRCARVLVLVAALPLASVSTAKEPAKSTQVTVAPRDGSHDFDFELGEWTTELKRLQQPLTGSTTWVEYRGTSTVRPILGGRANLVELSVAGGAGKIEGAALRLYDPAARQWSLNFFNIAAGQLTAPVIGEFTNGRGVFFGQDTYRGRTILVRFVISRIDDTTWRFEQAFSTDGGGEWEVNWIATDRRK